MDHGGNPHFEELCFIRVTPDDVEEDDHVRMTVWDSDDTDADEFEILFPPISHPLTQNSFAVWWVE